MTVVVYIWRTPTGIPYYVGIGTETRAYKFKRNEFTNKVTAKHGSPSVEIVARCKGRKQAEKLERYWVAHFGRRDLGTGTLTNLTSGGDAVNNLRPEARANIAKAMRKRMSTAETKNVIAESNRHRVWTPEQRARLSVARLGNQNCKGKRWKMTGEKYDQAVELAAYARSRRKSAKNKA